MRPSRVIAIGLALLVVAAAVVFVVLKSSLGTAPTAPPTGSDFADYQRPFGPTAPWNVPVAGLPLDSRSNEWRDRFWYYSRANRFPNQPDKDPDLANHGIMFGLLANPDDDFSIPVYNAKDATTTMLVRHRSDWNGGWNLAADQAIPWNPGWRASTGSDAQIIILDPSTGRAWGMWGLVQRAPDGTFNDSQCWSHKLDGTGYDRSVDLCAGGASLSTDNSGHLMDYRTYTGNEVGARGSSLPGLAMLTMPEEVAQGAIRHALLMPVYNTMRGPKCGPAVTTDADPALGTTCRRAIAPAATIEDGPNCGQDTVTGVPEDTRRRRAVPEGMRFALRLSDTDIDRWLDSRHYTGRLRQTARVFAVALRDYGWFITDTSCYAADFQVAGSSNPAIKADWRALGIQGDGRDLLFGLMTKNRIVTIAPATNHCTDGTDSHFECPANTTGY